ncbi:hypothetical protein AX17_000591 [Amanita inopinata Kibby_2008]|nr:hypothetical protein AX17_000591 [Amanita inopinata Kibby_2008]
MPLWSTILRPRPRSERSISLLKSEPSQAQLLISRPFIPLPTISSSPIETTFLSLPQESPYIRTPSITSSASTASTSSIRPDTPIAPCFYPNDVKRSQRTRIQQSAFQPYLDKGGRKNPGSSQLSSSCPPCKSILARSSSMSTRASQTTTAATGCTSSAIKSVKFVDIPTVHYASTDYRDFETFDGIEADACSHDVNMGMDVDSMEMESEIDAENQEVEDGRSISLEVFRQALCSTATPEDEREEVGGFKRLVSLSRKSSLADRNACLLPPNPRPTISGPFALGTVHAATLNDAWPPILSSAQSNTSSHPQKHLQPRLASHSSTDKNHLRSPPSMESFRSACSLGARSVRSLGSVKSTSTARGFRALLEKMGFASSIGMNVKAGWSVP